MKVEPHATFRFVFREIGNRNEAQDRLRTFLHDKEWLPADSDYDSDLLSYHAEADGICEVTLKEIGETSVEELADMFFSDLCRAESVKWVTVLYNENTKKLVCNYSDRYLSRQMVELSELKENEEVIILCRK